MNQVGQNKTFMLSTTSGSQIYSYVWKFWDNTSEATVYPTVQKMLNIGGNPLDDRSLYYTCNPVAVNGQQVVVNGSLQVNNPPGIVPSPSISTNDDYLPFSTRLRLDAFDVDQSLGDSPLAFDWYLGSYALGNGTLGTPYSYDGTWSGNDTVVVQTLTVQPCYYDTTVYSNRTIRCYVQDQSGGITYVDFDLRGYVRPPLETGISASAGNLGAGASTLPIKRIGQGYFEFVVDARDAGNAALSFLWSFTGANNWTVPASGAGAVSQNPDGSWRSVYNKNLAGEVVSSGTEKTAVAVCTVTSPSASTDVNISVVLVENSGPSNVVITYWDAETNAPITPPGPVPQGTKIRYEAVVTDPDGDICYMFWSFNSVLATEWPSPTNLIGPKVVVDTALWPVSPVRGTFLAVDRLFLPTLTGSVQSITLT